MSDAPVPVRDASTVVLLRDGADGLDVWLLTRATQMVFAGGMAVFPGGRVDDGDTDLPFAPGSVEAAAARFGCTPDQARALVGAAVREVFEETAVLLSVPGADLSGARADVEGGQRGFGELLRENGVAVDGGTVHPWSRWVTPAGEVRRYDTRFFVAGLPAGAEAQDVTTESSSAGWFGLRDALERARRGELGMMPPTVMTLVSLAEFATVDEVLAAAPTQSLDPVRPTIAKDDAGNYRAVLPDGSAFPLPRSLFGER